MIYNIFLLYYNFIYAQQEIWGKASTVQVMQNEVFLLRESRKPQGRDLPHKKATDGRLNFRPPETVEINN